MITKVAFTIVSLILIIILTLDFSALFLKRDKSRNLLLILLSGILGPLGMFYWGLNIGISSLLGLMLFLLPYSFFSLSVNFWFHIIRVLVFIWVAFKISSLPNVEIQQIKKFSFTAILVHSWNTMLGFLLYSFLVYSLLKVFA